MQKRYTINFVRERRIQEKKERNRQTVINSFVIVSFGLLTLTVLYTVFSVLGMQSVIKRERKRLEQIETEFKTFNATKMIIGKNDLEALDKLQNNRIYWTKKLAALAVHLPENYWIVSFSYVPPVLDVQGQGYIGSEQDYLLVIDKYLNKLRKDSTFNDIFNTVKLVSSSRVYNKEDQVGFEFQAIGKVPGK